jgi:hypothetical protein
MQTKQQFMKEAKQELGYDYKNLIPALETEYYNMIETYVKQGNPITRKVFESLSDMQKYHFTKHYNYKNNMVLN